MPRGVRFERIQFLFGCATSCTGAVAGDGDEAPIQAYVVFTYGGGSVREHVALTAWRGRLEAAPPAPY